MKTMLTFKEKEIASKLLREANSLDTQVVPEWGAWVLYALGGLLIVFVCLTTAGNLSGEVIRLVLLPGVAIGCFLLLVGAVITHVSQRAEEKKIMAGLLKKLMARGHVP